MASREILSLDTATPQIVAPQTGDTYSAPRAVAISPESLTGSAATTSLDITQTWNTTGTPTAVKLNVTDTASNAASNLMDLQVGGTSQFAVSKAGKLTGKTNANLFSVNAVDINGSLYGVNIVGIGSNFLLNGANTLVGLSIGSTFPLSWSSNSNVTNYGDLNTVDLKLFRDAANTLALRNATNAQTFNVYNTYTSSTNYERGFLKWNTNVLQIGTEKGSGGGTARALEFQTDGTTRLTFGAASGMTISGTVSNFFIDCQTYFSATTASASRVTIGSGVTLGSAYQYLFSSTTGANGSPDVGLARSAAGKVVITNGSTGAGTLVLRDAGDIELATTTGTKIGTATSQKLAFWNATPVVQPTAVADATDNATAITQLNALLGHMRTLGLIAT